MVKEVKVSTTYWEFLKSDMLNLSLGLKTALKMLKKLLKAKCKNINTERRTGLIIILESLLVRIMLMQYQQYIIKCSNFRIKLQDDR